MDAIFLTQQKDFKNSYTLRNEIFQISLATFISWLVTKNPIFLQKEYIERLAKFDYCEENILQIINSIIPVDFSYFDLIQIRENFSDFDSRRKILSIANAYKIVYDDLDFMEKAFVELGEFYFVAALAPELIKTIYPWVQIDNYIIDAFEKFKGIKIAEKIKVDYFEYFMYVSKAEYVAFFRENKSFEIIDKLFQSVFVNEDHENIVLEIISDCSSAKASRDNSDIECGGDPRINFCNNAKWTQPEWRDGNIPDLNLDNPPRKDSIIVPTGGYVVLRIRSDNPGKWFLHCHIEVHALDGMAMVINEAIERSPSPPAGFPMCSNFYLDPLRDIQFNATSKGKILVQNDIIAMN